MRNYGPWYTSFWKILFLVIVIGVFLLGLAFAGMVYSQLQRINSGDTTSPQLTNQVPTTPTTNGFTPGRSNDPSIGLEAAPVEIIAFEDFECPFCAQAAPVINELLLKYPNKIVFVYRDFPLTSIHPQSHEAALAAECANEQAGFWEYHDILFENQSRFTESGIFTTLAGEVGLNTERFESCLTSQKYADEVEQDYNEGVLAGVKSTPTYFVNGQMVEGAFPLETWETIVEAALDSY